MKLESIRITNVLGVSAADIRIDKPVTLIAGKNFAGKSSIQECVRMALVGDTVRGIDLKKDYGSLVHEGESNGLIEIAVAGALPVWFSLPDGKSTPITEYVPPKALPYVLDAQRFAKLTEQDRRNFLFGLTGLSAGSAEVKNKLLARGCDAAKVEAVLPLLRVGASA